MQKQKSLKLLKVGDPHATVSNLSEMRSLFDFILKTALIQKVDHVVLMGDLFHTHAWLRIEVLMVWHEILTKFIADNSVSVIILEGNHDQPGPKEMEGKMSAVQALKLMFDGNQRLQVITKPKIIDGIGFLPYTSNEEKFYQWANELYERGATGTLECHATFQGSTYDNGMYAPGGFDLSKVSQKNIISGHIHKFQMFDKAMYIGTPKWETAVDADQEKGIWLMSATNGLVDVDKAEFISTASVVTPMRKIVLKEDDAEPILKEGSKYLIEFVGPSSWITKAKKQYVGRAAIKTTFTDSKQRSKRESTGASTIEEFLDKDFKPSIGVNRKKLVEYVMEN